MSGSVNPIDQPEGPRPADLSALGMQGRNVSLPPDISPANKANITQSIADLQNLSGARNALMTVLDNLSLSEEDPTVGSSSPSATTRSSGAIDTSASVSAAAGTSVEEAQKQALLAETALDNLKTATTTTQLNEFYNALKTAAAAARQAALLSGNDPAASAASRQAEMALAEGTKIFDAVTIAVQSQTKAENSLTTIQTSNSISEVNTALKNAQAAATAAQKAIKDSGNHPLASSAAKAAQEAATMSQGMADRLNEASDAAKAAAAAAAGVSGSSSSTELSKQIAIIQNQLTIAQSVLDEYPNSPIAQGAVSSISSNLATLQELASALQGVISGIVSGGASGGAQQSAAAQATVNIQSAAFLLDSDNTTVSIILNGFRQMIRQFREDSPNFRPDLQGVIDKLDSQTFGDTVDEKVFSALTKGFDSLKQKLNGIVNQKTITPQMRNQALTDIVSSFASMTGTNNAIVPGFAQMMSQMLNFSSGVYGGLGANPTALSGFVNNINGLNNLYPKLSSTVQSMVDSAMDPVVQTPLVSQQALTKAVNTPGASANTVAMQGLLGMAQNAGSMVGVISVLEGMTSLAKANATISFKELKEKLTQDITKAPQYKYPYMQLPKDTAESLVNKLTEDFIQTSRMTSESEKNRFQVPPFFVQQFYVNIASLYPFLRDG